jgi:hypothetical protein
MADIFTGTIEISFQARDEQNAEEKLLAYAAFLPHDTYERQIHRTTVRAIRNGRARILLDRWWGREGFLPRNENVGDVSPR